MERVENRNHGFCRSESFTTRSGAPVLDVRPIRAICPFGIPTQRQWVSDHRYPAGYAPRPRFSSYPIFDEAEVRRKLERDVALRATRQQKTPAGAQAPSRDHSGGCSAKDQVSEGTVIGADGQSSSAGNEQNIYSTRNGHIENQQGDFPGENKRGQNLREDSIPGPKWNAPQPAVVPKAEYIDPGEILSHGGGIGVEQPSQVGGHPPLTQEANTQSGNAMGLMDPLPLQQNAKANTQSGNAMGLMDPLPLQQNAKDARSAFAKSLKRFKDLTVLEPGWTSETCNNMAPVETRTATKKRKRSSKGAIVYSASDKDKMSAGEDRKLLRKTRMIYDALRRSLSVEDEISKELVTRRPDLKAGTVMMDKGLCINRDRRIIGPIPGVHVGDQFYFRMELCIIGLHRQVQAGIDYITAKTNELNEPLAISIIDSGGYEDNEDGGEVLIYTGQGGNNYKLDKKQTVDQRLERGNLALERSMHHKVDIRVIRGIKDGSSPSGTIYVYDGLYKVHHSWLDRGRSGCGVFKYMLHRTPGQPELGSAVLKSTGRWRSEPLSRPGILQLDISAGAENLPVSLVNTADGDKGPAHFEYIGKLRYFNSVAKPEPSQGCNCTGGCRSGGGCSCALQNGGLAPYNANGILITGRPLIYECGECCRCPPTCRNRVSQSGLKHRLEVFRRRHNGGWGVRSWDSIPPGAFLCEYIGEVVPAAERRPEDGQYLLSAMNLRERWREWDGATVSDVLAEENHLQAAAPCQEPPPLGLGFAIDASRMGNVARFINHCCSPNVTVQFVLRDHRDIRFPRAMLFALESIPPLTELTLDYGRCYQTCLCAASDGNGGMSPV